MTRRTIDQKLHPSAEATLMAGPTMGVGQDSEAETVATLRAQIVVPEDWSAFRCSPDALVLASSVATGVARLRDRVRKLRRAAE